MPRPQQPEHPLAGKVFRGGHAIRHGLLTKEDLRTDAWQRLFHGIYADANLKVSHRTRCVAAAKWLFPAEAVIAGRSAIMLHGGLSPGDGAPVEVLTAYGWRRGPRRGLRVHVACRSDSDVTVVHGVPVTTVERTCWDVAQWHDTPEATAAIDSLLARRLIDHERLERLAHARRLARGGRRFARVVELADGGAESPQESRLRVRLVLAGLPRPVTQYVINHQGRFIARADLAWPERKVALEYDGVWHDDREQFHRDRERLNQMQAAGWTVLNVTARRLRDDFDGLMTELRAALGRPQLVERV